MESRIACMALAVRPALLLLLAVWASSAAAFPGFGAQVDSNCASLGYPLDPQFEPQVSGDCFACHNDGAGGSGAGKTAYSNRNWEFFCPAPPANIPPVAAANGPYAGDVGEPIAFSSAGSGDADGTIVTYLWDFGDGTTSSEPNPVHAYGSAADYSVQLTVTDDWGDSASSSTSASVSMPATNEPPTAAANGPYAGEVDQPIAFSSAGSSDTDGSIVAYLWDFGDGGTSTEPNPTHTYSAAMDYSVTLTVTDDWGDSDTSASSANVTLPAVNEPDILLDPVALDFNQVEVGTTMALAATLENTGTQVLSVTSVTNCGGTSTEFNGSPGAFDVEPGGSVALSVSYTPADELLDDGCLQIMSNDPDESMIQLAVSGTGYVPAPVMSDVDITRFAAARRARLGQGRPVSIRVVLMNPGLDSADADVLLTATQSGVVVYEEQVGTTVLAGQQSQVEFPPFTPSEAGDIEWHIDVVDEDPDIDEATTMTHVVEGKTQRGGGRDR
jgi:PKD repeat protein